MTSDGFAYRRPAGRLSATGPPFRRNGGVRLLLFDISPRLRNRGMIWPCPSSGGWRFITPVEGMTLYERTSDTFAVFRSGAWEIGILRGSALFVGGQQVVGARSAAIASPSGGTVVDAEARTTIDDILNTLRQHGLIGA